MLRTFFITIILFAALSVAGSQTVKYFRFAKHDWQGCGWPDSSFIAATSDTEVIRSVRTNLTLPVSQRWLISGYIAAGSGGYNHNAGHWFNWHFLAGWHLAAVEIEFCDGCASGLESNPALLAGDTIRFCPWSSYPVEELEKPTAVDGQYRTTGIEVFPVPASGKVYFRFSGPNPLTVTFYDFAGRKQKVMQVQDSAPNSLDGLTAGQYLLRIEQENLVTFKRLVVGR